jgi:hypothetical protein
MAGRTDRSATGGTGPTSRRSTAGRPRSGSARPKMNSVAVPIEADATPTSMPAELPVSPAAPLAPDLNPRTVETQKAYRILVASGFLGADAASLIGYVVGLPTAGATRWTLPQINRLLFLREVYLKSGWGDDERRPA